MIGFSHARPGGLQRTVVTATIAVCALTSFASAQTALAPAVKAAFLFNFAKFTEWPADALAPGQPLVLCVISDRVVGEMLTDLTRGHVIDDHQLVVSTMKPDSSAIASCRLLFMSGLDAKRSGVVLESLAGKSVFTVGDLDRFVHIGGVASFFVENGAVRFAINLDAAQRARIRLSSRLLNLARIERDEHPTFVAGPMHPRTE